MRQKNGMRLVQGMKSAEKPGRSIELQGLTGWLLGALRSRRNPHAAQKRLQLIETLPLGGKRQLMLVSCEGEMFLVGGNFESVETIVSIKSAGSQAVAKEVDETCR